MSETSKHRELTVPYCEGNGIDIGSGGDPVVPWAISFDLPRKEFLHYHSDQAPANAIHWGGDAASLPFKDGVCDFVYSSHVIEDFYDWHPYLIEWARVLKSGGHLVIMLPDKVRWNAAILNGQPPNCEHRHESYAGELTEYTAPGCPLAGFKVISDRLTDKTPEDYNIIFIAQKP